MGLLNWLPIGLIVLTPGCNTPDGEGEPLSSGTANTQASVGDPVASGGGSTTGSPSSGGSNDGAVGSGTAVGPGGDDALGGGGAGPAGGVGGDGASTGGAPSGSGGGSDGGAGGNAVPSSGGAGGDAAPSTGGAGVGAAPSTGGAGGDQGQSRGGSSGAGGEQTAGGGAGNAEPAYEPIADEAFDELPLFDGNPPNFKTDAPAETDNGQGSISNVSVPTLRRFAMDNSIATGFGYIVLPGGAYTGLDMDTHATRLAERVGPLGIAVFALKYRVGGGSNDAPRDALLDVKRAVRMVKHNAARWGVQSQRVGVIGYSAGSHLALNLTANFDAGDPNANDPIESYDSRPAFVGSMSTWSFYEPTSPFTFPDEVPPVYFCHAEDDTLAPIALAREVEGQISAKGAATQLDFYQTGGHSTCHPGDEQMEGHDWPDKFLPWLQTVLP